MTQNIDAKALIKKSVPEKKANQSTTKPTSRLPIITFILSLIALGCSVYAINTILKPRSNPNKKTSQTLNQIQQFNTTLTHVSQEQDTLDNRVTNLDSQVQSLLHQSSYSTKDWLLLKARYCIELAQINAHWGDDTETTISLMQEADSLLANNHDQRLFSIRQTLAKEIATLQAVPKVDQAGLLSQLDAAQDVAATLPLKPVVMPVENTKNISDPTKTQSNWRERLQQNLKLFEKLIVIRRHDDAIVPLPSVAYEAMLRQEIRLNLQEAQWAILQNNEAVYQFALAQAVKNIPRSFALGNPITEGLMKQLTELQKTHLTKNKPLVNESLPLLNQVIESTHTEETPQ